VLAPAAQARLQFVDDNGRPVADLPVRAGGLRDAGDLLGLPEGLGPMGRTDATGRVTLSGLPRQALLMADWLGDRYAEPGRADARMLSGEQHVLAPIRLLRGITVTGRVLVKASGRPMAGVTVAGRYGSMADGGAAWADTDDHGVYRLTRLRPGPGAVGLVATPALCAYWAAPAHRDLTFEAGLSYDGLDFALEPGRSLIVRVIAEDTGLPLTGLAVRIEGTQGLAWPNLPLWLDTMGTAICRVLPGEQRTWLVGRPPPGYDLPPLDQARQVAQVSTDEPVTVVYRLKPQKAGSLLRGRVVTPSGQPVAGAIVDCCLSETPGQPPPSAISGADGRFQIALPGGTHERLVRARHGRLATPDWVAARPALSVTLRLAEGVVCRVTVPVTDERGQPVPGAVVRLIQAGPNGSAHGYLATADAQGEATFAECWPAQVCWVSASASGFADSQEARFTMSPGRSIRTETVALPRADTEMEVYVFDDQDRPVRNATVTVKGSSRRPASGYTNGDGWVKLTGLVRGDIELRAESADGRMSGALTTRTDQSPAVIRLKRRTTGQ